MEKTEKKSIDRNQTALLLVPVFSMYWTLYVVSTLACYGEKNQLSRAIIEQNINFVYCFRKHF